MIEICKPTRILLLGALAIVASATLASAHGGRFRGPLPGVIPPNAPPPTKTPGPKAPRVKPPGPLAPRPVITPGARTGAGSAGGPKTPRGFAVVAPDASRWQLWWEFNKDRYQVVANAAPSGPVTGGDEYYLGSTRRRAVAVSKAPKLDQLHALIQPALKRALVDTNDPNLVTACLIAMAKIGKDKAGVDLLPLITKYLSDGSQEVRETAALALGISRRVEALPLLRDLLLDNADGRALTERSRVGHRVRSFAAYGLGILAAKHDVSVDTEVFSTLHRVLHDERTKSWDVQVGVIQAMGVLGLDAKKGGAEKRLLWRLLPSLKSFYTEERGKGARVVQAHVPISIGRLLGPGDDVDHARFRELFRGELLSKSKRHNASQQSAVLALGMLAESSHEADVEQLSRYFKFGKNQQARYFSLISMGAIGGEKNRNRLLSIVTKGRKVSERPWAALALGTMAHRERTATDGRIDATIGDALFRQLKRAKNREAAGAFAVGLGLCGYKPAAKKMREMLESHRHHDQLVGYLCIGLALMGEKTAAGDIRVVLYRSTRRPDVLRQAAIALGILRDKSVVDDLLELLGEDNKNTARMAALAGALHYVGDHRTVKKLLKLLFDDELTKLSRAFVAAALGGIADPMVLPFNARYAAGCNYRASVPSLFNQATGILDLL